jgi:hypothetical protein
MNTITNYIPENWNPECETAFVKWQNRIIDHHARKFNVEFETV